MKTRTIIFFLLVMSMIMTACGTDKPVTIPSIVFEASSAGYARITIETDETGVKAKIQVFADDGQDTSSWRQVLNIEGYRLNNENTISGKWVTDKRPVPLKLVVSVDDFSSTLYATTDTGSTDVYIEQEQRFEIKCDSIGDYWRFSATHSENWGGINQYGLAVYVDQENGEDIPYLTFSDANPGQINYVHMTVPQDKKGWKTVSFESDRRALVFNVEQEQFVPLYCKK